MEIVINKITQVKTDLKYFLLLLLGYNMHEAVTPISSTLLKYGFGQFVKQSLEVQKTI